MKREEAFALLYGIMLGDGCISQYKTKEGRERYVICITGDYYTDKKFYDKVIVPILKKLGRKSVKIKTRLQNGTIEINFPDRTLFNEIFKAEFPIGKKGINLKISDYFFEKNLINKVIQGFFATDGCIVLTKNPNKFYPRLEGHGIAKKLLIQIKDELIKKGLNGKFYMCKRNKKDTRWKTAQQQYRFQFNGEKNLMLFDKLVGFINPKHKKKAEVFIKYSKEYNNLLKKIPTQKQKRDKINKKFIKKMAAPRFELGTSSS